MNNDSEILWRNIGKKSFRAIWTAAVSRYAYFEMKTTIPYTESMTFKEVVATLKEKLETEHAGELDTHWEPPPEDPVSKKSTKTKLSERTVEENDVDDDDDNIEDGHNQNNEAGEVHEQATDDEPDEAEETGNSEDERDTRMSDDDVPASDEDEPDTHISDAEVPDSDEEQTASQMTEAEVDERLAGQLELLRDA